MKSRDTRGGPVRSRGEGLAPLWRPKCPLSKPRFPDSGGCQVEDPIDLATKTKARCAVCAKEDACDPSGSRVRAPP